MFHQLPGLLSPAEEYERRIDHRRDQATWRIRLSTLSWSLVQTYALCDVSLGLILRPRYDSDAAITTTMIWFVSVPCALGASLFTLKAWPILRRRVIIIGLLPWFVTAAEATALAILWLRS